jgi:hypothetical protein
LTPQHDTAEVAESNVDDRGFSARVGEKVLGQVSGWGKQYNALVEENQKVSIL